ncbi:IclR family transcriptional regulator [Streptomyces shenzhenensis]|nr:IclR family transcriptional regulator [Streptomyces shenzhenensis]
MNTAVGSDSEAGKLVGSDRVLAVLKELARYPDGVSLVEMTRAMNSPKPTIHRALTSLCRSGLADRDARGHYVLGDELLRMAFAHYDARPEHVRLQSALKQLAEKFQETAHYAVLDGREVVYRAKVDPHGGAVRMTSVIGGRNPAHCTAIGKVLLSRRLLTREAVEAWVGGAALQRRTPQTMCTAEELHQALEQTRCQGFGIDDQENEVGVNCLAVPVFLKSPSEPTGAVSISALTYRKPIGALIASVDAIRDVLASSATERA